MGEHERKYRKQYNFDDDDNNQEKIEEKLF